MFGSDGENLTSVTLEIISSKNPFELEEIAELLMPKVNEDWSQSAESRKSQSLKLPLLVLYMN